jgi:benzoyl-CoA reductase/2-hydroxyglutaryl-CoA dehydratase subunit BcrC/BadD/HgdB
MGFKLDKVCPYFQVSDWVIGETTCDGEKKAWEILNEHIPTYVMDLPQKKDADYKLTVPTMQDCFRHIPSWNFRLFVK